MAFPTKSLNLVRASSQYASIASGSQTGLNFTGDFTLEGWLKTPASTGVTDYSVFGRFDSGTNAYLGSWGCSTGTAINNAALIIFKGGSEMNAHIPFLSTLSASTWYHVAWVFTAASTKYELFLNFVSQGTNTTFPGAPNSNSALFTLGADNGGGGGPEGYFMGNIGLFRAWSSARTASQLSTNACIELGSTTNLSAEWTLNGVYTDNSGNGNTLTPTNSPVFQTDVTSFCPVTPVSKSGLLNFF